MTLPFILHARRNACVPAAPFARSRWHFVRGSRRCAGPLAAQRATPAVAGSDATKITQQPREKNVPAVAHPPKPRDLAKRPMYWGGIGSTAVNAQYLNGTMPGDYGFDPLDIMSGFVGDDAFISKEWLQYAELIHCRWAMLGAAGCVAPEVLGMLGLIPESTGLVWFRAGVIPPQGTFDYWASPNALFGIQIVLMGFAEFRRLQDYRNPGSMANQDFLGLESVFAGSGNPGYPGGKFFNMFNYGAASEEKLMELKIKEVKNGRLSMLACLGIFMQSLYTGVGPVKNLVDHATSPFTNNFFQLMSDIPSTSFLI